MKIAKTMRKYIYKYLSLYMIGAGSLFIVLGGYWLLSRIENINPGIGYILMGISFITMGISLIKSIYLKRKWILIFSFVATMCLAVWVMFFNPFPNRNNIANKGLGVHQETVIQAAKPHNIKNDILKKKGLKQADVPGDGPAGATSGTFDGIKRLMPPDLRDDPMLQKLMAVMESDSFQEEAKALKPENIQEYVDLLEEHGVTGLSEIDFNQVLADGYDLMTRRYHAKNPGKTPEDEDEAMAKRFGQVLKEEGLEAAMNQIMMDRENVIWMNARFKGDVEAFSVWWADVVAVSEKDLAFPHGGGPNILADENTFDISLAETEQAIADRALSEVREANTRADDETREVTTPVVEPEKGITEKLPAPLALPTDADLEASLKERFSSERFERAMSTLDRYGPEEGLRRLRASDAEIAKQIEDSRRAGVEQHHNSEGKVEDLQ